RLLTQLTYPGCRLSYLRHAFFVGDKLTQADVDSLRRLAPQVTCVNYYGSTETQRAVSYYEVPEGSVGVSQKAVIPVGRGMPDVQLLVLNKANGLAGIGEVGEIHMRSPHLARGYLNDDNLTKARFVINPFTDDRSERLYKTGDLGRYLPDGNVEILGRTDGQIKLRGFRIEPAEIELVLTQHPEVPEAVVTVHENSLGDQRLVGYVVHKQGPDLTHELRSFLRMKLPDYMVPSTFVFLDKLPLTPNGKVDRKALPAPDQSRPELEESYVTPRTPVEEVVASIWSEVLNLENVGIHDNFFELGGHSLLATRVVSRIIVIFQIELPLRALFEMPTVASLSEHIEAIRWAGDENPPIARDGLSQKEQIIL
ncbi:MAG TPA: phosphopantetheine-binding protein, partial [Edaphobacter sp.]|nr:phosphopantetheine-binding protein [Edaphobacter sp.]